MNYKKRVLDNSSTLYFNNSLRIIAQFNMRVFVNFLLTIYIQIPLSKSYIFFVKKLQKVLTFTCLTIYITLAISIS